MIVVITMYAYTVSLFVIIKLFIGFSISLLCTGLLSIEVDVKIQLNVSTTASNLISLDIRRKKPCLRGQTDSKF